MLVYVLRRILVFIPTLLIISIATFLLSKLAPGDLVESRFENNYTENLYLQEAKRMGLDKPTFYFSLTTQGYPDTLHKVVLPDHRGLLNFLCGKYGNWDGVNQYYQKLRAFDGKIKRLEKDNSLNSSWLSLSDAAFLEREKITYQKKIAEKLKTDSIAQQLLGVDFDVLLMSYQKMEQTATPSNHLLPNFIWHGFDNQYHHWISNFIMGDFGVSDRKGNAVTTVVKEAVFWTLIINFFAIVLAFGIAIPLGVKAAVKENSRFDRVTTFILYGLFSLPAFWIGTLLLVFFTNHEYGMNWFPSVGFGQPAEFHKSFWSLFKDRAAHLILPILCVTYPALAFIFRQMRGSMVDQLNQNYIQTARAKGLNEKTVVWKHAFRNALFPIITMMGSILPALVAGSLTIEVVFNIPGMGWLMVESIRQANFPVVYAIMMLGAVMTMVGILVADLLYAKADPRVRF